MICNLYLLGTRSLSINSHRTILCFPFLNGHLNMATGFSVISGRGSMSSDVSKAEVSQGGTSVTRRTFTLMVK